MENLLRVLSLDPSYPDAHFQIGHLRQLNGDLEGAMEEYEKELQIDPGNIKAVNFKNRLERSKK